MDIETIIAAFAGFFIGCVLCFFVDPHKIYLIESRQRIMSDLVKSDFVSQGIVNRVGGLLDASRDRIQNDSTLQSEMRENMAKDDFWNRFKSDKAAEMAELKKVIDSRFMGVISDLSLSELIDLRECYRRPASAHWQKIQHQRRALSAKNVQKDVDNLSTLAIQYYWERHPMDKSIQKVPAPNMTK